MIRQYVYRNRDGKRTRVGLMVGVVDEGCLLVGYSLCCREDKFDRDKALAIAVGRAISDHNWEFPPSILGDVNDFVGRCKRYFKGLDVA